MSISLNQILNGISYRVLADGSGQESFGPSGANGSAILVFLCNWPDRLTFREQLVGSVFQDPSGNIVATPAFTHPDYPGLYGQSAQIAGWGKPTGTFSWQYAKITTTFGPRPTNSNDPTQLKEESFELSGEIASDEGSKWLDESGNALPDTHRVNIALPYKTYQLTFYQAPSKPSATVDALYGKTNSAPFNDNDAHTMVYSGYKASRRTTVSGSENWSVTHHFMVSPIDIRKEFVGGEFQLIVTADGKHKYEDGDFSVFNSNTMFKNPFPS